ncbi:MAG: TAXI family TRAP transporter solute-binding subunit [Syntrophaceae bacterium]
MGRGKIRELSPRALTVLFASILLIILISLWVGYSYVRPFPPDTLVMCTGMEGGSYARFGELYRKILAQNGIRVELRPTSGAVENLNLLADKSQKVDAGFVQGTVGKIEAASNLVSLGSVSYTPLWVFYRAEDILDDLSQLKGRRIAIGPQGSGIQKFALELLKVAGVASPPAVLYEYPYPAALSALKQGNIDAVMVTGQTDHQLVLELLRTKDVKLMSFSMAEAYTRFSPDLFHVVLPKGVINPANKFPPSDFHLLSPTTNLIVRKDLHPALVYLLLKASMEIHGGASWVNKAGEFPSLGKQDDPISDQARRFYAKGGSVLYDNLPFWAATFLDRIILLVVPLAVILVPLIGIAPWIYTWRNRSKYYKLYNELRNVEKGLQVSMPPENIRDIHSRLDRIEEALNSIRISTAFLDEVNTMKEHVQVVRKKLVRLNLPETPEDIKS